MSRLTPAQIIARGEYLDPDFEPATLTVSQLLGVLTYHDVRYPTPYSKTRLVQLFNEEIKPRSAKLNKERLKRENSQASEDGIKDGITGKPIAASRKTTAARRSTRRSSRLQTQQDEDSESSAPLTPLEPPKRRRSSAQPSLGGAGSSHSIVPTEPTLLEESEPDDSEVPPRKFGKSKKNADIANAHARKSSNPFSEYEDSGWEDNNIFQSGAEDSSPVRPVKTRTRTSLAPRKSRKSMSAPPQVSPSRLQSSPQSPQKLPAPKFEPFTPAQKLPSQDIFQPKLSPSVSLETDKIIRLIETPSKAAQVVNKPADDLFAPSEEIVDHGQVDEAASLGETSEAGDVTPADEADQVVDEDRVSPAAFSKQTLTLTPQGPESQRWPIWLRILFSLFALISTKALYDFKTESASMGFCNRGSNSNEGLESLRAHRAAVMACNQNRTLFYTPSDSTEASDSASCPLPPLLPPFMQPNACTPCPDHATCSPHAVVCDNGYISRSHPFLFFLPPPTFPVPTSIAASSPSDVLWKTISAVADGVPGIGSVALPPRCVQDPKRKRNIGVLGKAIEAMLGQERGRRVCAGGKYLALDAADKDGGEARKWGVEVEKLRDVMRQKTSPNLLHTFDDTFNEALQQLIQWGGVVIGEDQEGHRYLAHKTPDLTWNCALTVKSRKIWAKWRTTVFGIGLLIMIVFYGRARRVQKRAEGKRIAELVQIALDALRNQELAHHTDPITAPHPYLSSVQLRDLILQDVHSVSKRQRLWDAVEHVVESNSNVRANLEETIGGEEMRVWRWIGSARRASSGFRKSIAGASPGVAIESIEQADKEAES